MEYLFMAAILGVIPGVVAHSKGRSFLLWWLYGFMVLIIALPHSLFMKADQQTIETKQLLQGMIRCEYCAEVIKRKAKVCRFCQKDVTESKQEKS